MCVHAVPLNDKGPKDISHLLAWHSILLKVCNVATQQPGCMLACRLGVLDDISRLAFSTVTRGTSWKASTYPSQRRSHMEPSSASSCTVLTPGTTGSKGTLNGGIIAGIGSLRIHITQGFGFPGIFDNRLCLGSKWPQATARDEGCVLPFHMSLGAGSQLSQEQSEGVQGPPIWPQRGERRGDKERGGHVGRERLITPRASTVCCFVDSCAYATCMT